MNTKATKAFSVISGVLLALCAVVLAVFTVTDLCAHSISAVRAAISIVTLLTAFFGAYYILSGAKKSGAVLLKIYFGLNIVKTIILFGIFSESVLPTAVKLVYYLIPFLGYSVLTMEKDLGHVRSMVIAVLIALAQVFGFVSMLILAPAVGANLYGQITGLIIGISVVVLVAAKYADKKARGTK